MNKLKLLTWLVPSGLPSLRTVVLAILVLAGAYVVVQQFLPAILFGLAVVVGVPLALVGLGYIAVRYVW